METRKFKLTFTEESLGTCPGNKEIMTEFVATKNPNGVSQDELDASPDIEEDIRKAATFFARDPQGVPSFWDYQIKGWIKGGVLAMITGGVCTQESLKKVGLTKYLYKRTIDLCVFVGPRMIPIQTTEPVYFIERPLRAETQKGERMALARSEAVAAGSSIEFTLSVMRKDLWDAIEWILAFGEYQGISQWRNSGKGRFTWEEVK
jgi:hypothetical protein